MILLVSSDIYMFCFSENLSIYHLYVLLLAYMPYPSIISFSSGFQVLRKLLRQFAPDMSALWPGHICPSGLRVYIWRVEYPLEP
jgi:hypothetical protein